MKTVANIKIYENEKQQSHQRNNVMQGITCFYT